jgi:16S rRNA G527 N7-methylase RsmG
MFHVKHEGSISGDLSPEQVERLRRYEDLLRERGAMLGVVSKADVPELWVRHIQDSLRAITLIPASARRVCDLGSGGGLPGVPLAIARPDVEAVPVPNAAVFAGPAEEMVAEADVVVARGFGDARTTWEGAQRLLGPEGCLLYWAGATFSPEMLPEGVAARLADEVALESGGPIVIMTQQ